MENSIVETSKPMVDNLVAGAANEVGATVGQPTITETTVTQQFRAKWLPLVAILALALVIRVGFIPDVVYHGDVEHFGIWVNLIRDHGVLNFYSPLWRLGNWDRTYPPLATMLYQGIGLFTAGPEQEFQLGQYPVFIFLLKFIPILFELALIAAAYQWLEQRDKLHNKLQIVIPTLLAIYPGLVIVSPWWGQYESPYVLFVVLSLIALNKDKPIRAWLMFAIAIMFKQPAVVIGPLLLVLSFRRFGWKPTLIGLGICAGLSAVLFIPFILGSGFGPALSPYLGAGDVYPFLTNNAYNFWYAVAFMRTGQAVPLFSPAYGDKMLLIGGFSAKFSGFLMFGLYVLIIMVLAWKHYQRRQEFLWATALFMAFFLFPTQVHERYIYPAGVLTILAAAQDRRMWWVAAGVAITFTFNVLGVAIPYRHNWPIGAWGVQEFALPTALFNISMFVVVTWMLVRQSQDNSSDDVVPLGYVR